MIDLVLVFVATVWPVIADVLWYLVTGAAVVMLAICAVLFVMCVWDRTIP